MPGIHGWSTAQVQVLQKAAAEALGRPVVFRDSLRSPVKLHQGLFAGVFGRATVIDQGPEMVIIPAGRFLMGSPDSEAKRDDDEGPQHQVTISRPFALGRYAVTFDDYDAFCAATGRSKPGDEGWGRGRRPMIEVSWEDAVAYSLWLSGQTGRPYRLPTEAEWEYACRAGTTTPFSTGACLSTDQANYNGNSPYPGCLKGQYRGKTVEVGSLKAPNPWGLHDMHGNVWEWCQDWFGPYASEAATDPAGPVAGVGRVLRGGSGGYAARLLRSAYRNYWPPGNRLLTGLRLAQGPEPGQARQMG